MAHDTAPADTDDDAPFLDARHIARRIALFAVLAVAVAVALATLPGVGDVRDRLASARLGWIAVTGLLALGSVLGFVAALWSAFDRVATPRAALDLGLAEQGANVLLPTGGAGGPAFGALVMRRAGVPGALAAERHAALFLVTSAVSFVALTLGGLAQASGLLGGRYGLAATLAPAAFGAALLGGAVLFSRACPPDPPSGGRVRHALWRVRSFLHGGVRTSIELLRRGDPLFIGGAIAYYACDVAAVAAAFQAFGGGGPPLGAFVLAYTLGQAGALIPTPGGVGGTDGGLIGMFMLYGGPPAITTAAVLAYRVFQLGLPAILGAVALVRIRSRLASGAARAAVAERFGGLGSEA
jgi:uncharacterized membrane protein YbhN (UPF0104 family)